MRDDHRTRGRRCRHICNIIPYYVTEGREGNWHKRFIPGVFVQEVMEEAERLTRVIRVHSREVEEAIAFVKPTHGS